MCLKIPELMCRICERTSCALESLSAPQNFELTTKYMSCANVTFDPLDKLPKYFCEDCINSLNSAFKFKALCELTEQKFYDLLEADCEMQNCPTKNSNSKIKQEEQCAGEAYAERDNNFTYVTKQTESVQAIFKQNENESFMNPADAMVIKEEPNMDIFDFLNVDDRMELSDKEDHQATSNTEDTLTIDNCVPKKSITTDSKIKKKRKPCPMGNVCAVNICDQSKRKNPNIKFFKFPIRDKERQLRWCAACKISSVNIKNTKNLRVCNKHFDPMDILKKKLKQSAIPTLFLDNSTENVHLDNSEAKSLQKKCIMILHPHSSQFDSTNITIVYPSDTTSNQLNSIQTLDPLDTNQLDNKPNPCQINSITELDPLRTQSVTESQEP